VAIHPGGTSGRSDFCRLERARREAARRLIEASLTARSFSVLDIVDATGMSRASLYRSFEPQGGVDRRRCCFL
jgi:AraC-like DNA-binding protein